MATGFLLLHVPLIIRVLCDVSGDTMHFAHSYSFDVFATLAYISVDLFVPLAFGISTTAIFVHAWNSMLGMQWANIQSQFDMIGNAVYED